MTLDSKTFRAGKKEKKQNLQTGGRMCQESKIFVNLITAISLFSIFFPQVFFMSLQGS
jgi:hypothetical protein